MQKNFCKKQVQDFPDIPSALPNSILHLNGSYMAFVSTTLNIAKYSKKVLGDPQIFTV